MTMARNNKSATGLYWTIANSKTQPQLTGDVEEYSSCEHAKHMENLDTLDQHVHIWPDYITILPAKKDLFVVLLICSMP